MQLAKKKKKTHSKNIWVGGERTLHLICFSSISTVNSVCRQSICWFWSLGTVLVAPLLSCFCMHFQRNCLSILDLLKPPIVVTLSWVLLGREKWSVAQPGGRGQDALGGASGWVQVRPSSMGVGPLASPRLNFTVYKMWCSPSPQQFSQD